MVLARISTGCENIDSLIENGLPFKSIIHVYGEGGTGKSTFAMQCAKNCVLNNWKVLVLDNEKTCSSPRLKDICEAEYSEIAQSILVYEPNSFKNQTEVIENLEKYMTDKTRMIIIDTLTTEYRRAKTEKMKNNVRLNKQLNYQLAVLKDLTQRYELITLITNQVRGSIGGNANSKGIEPVAASILSYWADYEVLLGFPPDHQMARRTATMMKHPTNPNRTITDFRLTDEGIKDI